MVERCMGFVLNSTGNDKENDGPILGIGKGNSAPNGTMAQNKRLELCLACAAMFADGMTKRVNVQIIRPKRESAIVRRK